jgi:uncharacterized protein
MMKTLLIIFTILTFAARSLSAQQTTTQEPPYIEVTGTAEKEIIPDEIYINIIVKERYDGRDKITIESQEEKLKAAVQELGIPVGNLSLSDANANYVRVKWFNKDVLAQKEFILKVGDAFTVGKVFQKLDEIDITNADVARVSHSKIDSFRKETRIAAIKAAKDKAEYLLAAIGEKPAKPLIIQEKPIEYDDMQLNALTYRGNVYQRSGSDRSYYKEEEISFRKIKLSCSIYVKYAVK